MPAAVQRNAIAAFRHRFTLRQTRRTVPIMFSIELVQASERLSVTGKPRRLRVMLRNLWRIAGKVFLVALVLDAIYQIIVFHWIYPVQALIVATLLALVPCMLVRAVGNRIVSMVHRRQSAHRLDRRQRQARDHSSSRQLDTTP